MNRPLDSIDRAIIATLQGNARIPIAELAARVNVSESTAHRRLRSLVDDHVITKFTAEVDIAALGLQTEALIHIRLHASARNALRSFQTFLQELPESRHVYFVSGGSDFVVHVAVADSATLRDFVSDSISARPEVASTNTSLVFEHRPGSGIEWKAGES
ncbi:Lrp/AsnC family transcriptional regulator [Corynebacterium breve]|uniref:Lrp/AsnC family transcriptional regulator n=1 Tax=Corynebacterium breve TaxID=3049799 RepID=A0ABY8VGX1_9CORY|nr:Lrp/AsnC family transcriptional regulator [Corynebacterium breve]WIM66770.1 Lrp/AsnC family transcriptional regulator [Corynebacterium breve]